MYFCTCICIETCIKYTTGNLFLSRVLYVYTNDFYFLTNVGIKLQRNAETLII